MNRAFLWMQPSYAARLALSPKLVLRELATRAEVAFRLMLAADVAVELAALVAAQNEDADQVELGGVEMGEGGPTR